MGLFDQADDLQFLLRSRISHSSPSPSAIMLFFEQPQFQGLLGDDFLQRLGFLSQVLDLAAGRCSCCIPGQPPLAGFRNSFDQL